MKEYQVKIKETLVMTATVEAESAAQAQEIAKRNWNDGEYILDSDHFQDVAFSVPSRSDRER